MDEEGYPLPGPGAMMLQPTEENEEHAEFIDQESGEATGRRVVVLRKIPPTSGQSWAEYSYVRSRLVHEAFTHDHKDKFTPKISPNITLEHQSRVPLHWLGETFCPDSIYGLHINQDTTEPVSKVPFRVPHQEESTKRKPQGKEVTISIWREFCRGPLVYEDSNASWDDVKDTCLLWPHLQAIFGNSRVFIPLFCVCIVRVVLLMLKVFIPCIGVQLSYIHLFHVHLKIHMTGEKRGVHPVFIGDASQGPIIYSIRHMWCPYCRYNRESQVSLRYLEVLNRERQTMTSK